MFKSRRILSPRLQSTVGTAIQAKMLAGIRAGSGLMVQFAGSFLLKAVNLPFDSSSASSAPVFEQRVIFSIVSLQPAAVATLPIAVTSVVHSWHLVL